MWSQLLLFLLALAISWVVFTIFVRVVRTTISTALTVAVAVLILQVVFGIAPQQVWQQIQQLFQTVQSWFR